MGIYDREYYRREGPSVLDTFVFRGRVCKWLVIINVIAFIIQLLTRESFWGMEPGFFTNAFLLDTQKVMEGQVWRLLTYAFLHAPDVWQHIVFNMLFLWWFGSDMEELYGPREFLAIYLVSAVLGGLVFQAVAVIKGGPPMSCLGASGAVTAVMVLCALHYPNRIILLFFFLPLPIWVFVGFQVLKDALDFITNARTTTAVSVHLGGAALAFAYYHAQWRLMNLWPRLPSFRGKRSRPALRVFRGEEEAREPASVAAPARHADVDEQLEAKVDAVLEKVARSGKDSLTETERALLLRASEIYKRRRS